MKLLLVKLLLYVLAVTVALLFQISLAAECGVERFRIEMDNTLRSLSFYTLSDGDTIVVTVNE